jgi:hypothetical protein
MTKDESFLLQSIDTKLRALLALTVDAWITGGDSPRRNRRPLDVILSNAGLSTKEIANLMGKTDRSVRLVLQASRRKNPNGNAEPDVR